MPAPVTSFIRVLVNLLVLWGPVFSPRRLKILLGDGRVSLWLRGLFGGLALMLSFAALRRIGIGESAFIQSSNSVFIALLAPWILGQRNTWAAWLAIGGALVGLWLLLNPRLDETDAIGRWMALLAGIFTALAYLMVARSGRGNRPETVVFYFCLVAVLLHLVYFSVAGWYWPVRRETWVLLLLAGLNASVAQNALTRAYQMAPAALNAAVNYLYPVLGLAWSVSLFGMTPQPSALAGCALILVCGVLLPFLRVGKTARIVME
jgi:S-adenosylmethionine uptake transporter